MKRLSTVVLALCCGACATQPSNEPRTTDLSSARELQLAGAPIGLARVNIQPGVIFIEPSVEHVLYPGNEIKPPAMLKTSTSRRTTDTPKKVVTTQSPEPRVVVTAAPTPVPPPDLRASPASTEEMRRAWLKHCKDSPEMTSRDWEIVTTTTMPADIAEYWDKHCAEGS